ncbi:MAG: WD40/YVTN/BNR-like repeat-containing protein, partial [Ignavibacteria bacterium]
MNIVYSQSGWFTLTSPTNDNLNGVVFTNASTGFAVGGNTIIRTTDAGITWVRYPDTTVSETCHSVFFVNEITGYVGTQHSGLAKTTNSGNNWFTVNKSEFRSVYFRNSDTGYATGWVGLGGVIKKTTNGGINWIGLHGFYPSQAYNIFFPSEDTGYAGSYIYLYKSTNSGLNWTWIPYNNFGVPRNQYFINSATGYVCGGNIIGSNPNLHKTTDGGKNWTVLRTGSTVRLFSAHFLNSDKGYCVGDSGFIIRTTNAGASWLRQEPQTSRILKSVFFTSANTGYVVGDSGLILKTTTGGVIGIEPVSNIIPVRFKLYQNYPNPFNANSKIKVQISKLGYVKLVIYDVVGREVVALVNQDLNPGAYEVDFDGTDYPSGVYY